MKVSKDNPMLTAYALGELDAGEAGEVERAILADASLRAEVEAIRSLAGELEGELAAEPMPHLPDLARARLQQRAAELDRPAIAGARAPRWAQPMRSGRPMRWAAVAAAVLIAAGAVGMWTLLRPGTPGGTNIVTNEIEPTPTPPDPLPGPTIMPTPSPYGPYLTGTPTPYPGHNGYLEPSRPSIGSAAVTSAGLQRSTFGLNVDDASYRYVQLVISEEGRFPDPSDVRIEEMINHFRYDYGPPLGGDFAGPLAVRADLAQCPWSAGHVLLRVGIQAFGGGLAGDSEAEVVAREARVGVTFNPAAVASWRLIGYDGPMYEQASLHGEQIKAGRQVTALYELVPTSEAARADFAALAAACTVSLEYRLPDGGPARQLTVSPAGPAGRFEDAPDDFRFAATVAGFGMILKNSPHKGTCTFEGMLKQARSALGDDPLGQRGKFVEVLREATGLPPAEQ